MQVRYVGISDTRIINKTDWKQAGFDQEMTRWDSTNDFTAEVSEEAGQWLLANDPEFKPAKAEESEEEQAASPRVRR